MPLDNFVFRRACRNQLHDFGAHLLRIWRLMHG